MTRNISAPALLRAIKICKTQRGLANRMGIDSRLISNWLIRDKKVAMEYVPFICAAVDDPAVTPLTLRPDFMDGWKLLAELLPRAFASATSGSCEPCARWAFDLLDGIAAKRSTAPPPEAVRIALDAIRSTAGRAYAANATDEQRGRWCAALAALGGTAADLMPSRVPGADDEEPREVSA